jgi:hypothetical protein
MHRPGRPQAPHRHPGGWTPGELDVDWAEFAAASRSDYQSSQWASDAQADDEARDALRAEAAQHYRTASGAEGASFNDLGTQRTGALAQQYYDECDDGTNLPDAGVQASRSTLYSGGTDTSGGISYNPGPSAPPPAIDLRSMFILQSTDDRGRFDQTAFLVYACQEWGVNNLGAGGITFGLYTNFEDSESQYPTVLGDEESGPDFVVSIFPENNVPERPLQIMAVRTPSRDSSTWTVTFLDEANRLDRYEVDGVVPTSALGDFTADSGFAWTVEVVDSQQPAGGRDWFPERNYLLRAGEGEDEMVGTHIPQFPVPDDCGLQTEATRRRAFTMTPQAVTPNDDGYRFQWYHPEIRTPQAWDTIRDSSVGGRSRPVTVALVDTGIDSTRFDFRDGGHRVVAGFDAVYGLELEGGDNGGAIGPIIGPNAVQYEAFAEPHPRNSDRNPHGTGVASVMAARGNNEFGIAGVDWGMRLMPIRVVDVNGCISSTTVADGIKWAVDHGADIVHVSLASEAATVTDPNRPGIDGVPECADGLDNDGNGRIDHDGGPLGLDFADPGCDGPDDTLEGDEGNAPDPLRETIDYALEQGVAVVAAAGNQGSEDDPVNYPAAYPGVITVGATERGGERAFYSSTGRWLDVVAPGGRNTRALADDVAVLWELDRIRSAAGTSFSAPMVTGAMSLYLGLNPHIARGFTPSETPPPPGGNFPDEGYQRTVDDLRIAVQNGSRDIAPTGHDIFTGWGLLDVDRMLDVEALGGPLVDPARVQLPRTDVDSVVQATEQIALSRPSFFPSYAVVTRSDVAVDALAATPLLADAPLFVAGPAGLAQSTLGVMGDLLPPGAEVLVIGGDDAVSPAVEQQVRDAGFEPSRLEGASRYETAVAIGEEVRRRWGGGDRVALGRADGGDDPTAQWADALTGGAWAASTRTPLLVTDTTSLHPAVAAALTRWETTSTVVFGGTAAVSEQVLDDLPTPERVAGADRAATATAIAEELWGGEVSGYMLVNGYYARGWAFGMAAAGWAADVDSPLLYTGASAVPPATADLLSSTCPDSDELRLIGGASLVTGTAESALLEAVTC